ncbi:hypothetical protein HK101_011330 [Irineochytrium annulatum]|nr:hypothetical protein HK101_011330 [Irineochytrium annulatum]
MHLQYPLVLLLASLSPLLSLASSPPDDAPVAPATPASVKHQFQVLHRVDGDKPFSRRGVITYDPASRKKAANKYENNKEDKGVQEVVTARAGEDTLYYVELRHVGPVAGVEGVMLNASVRLCLLQASKYHEHMNIHFDQAGIPFHLDYIVNSGSCTDKPPAFPSNGFKTTVSLARKDVIRPRLEQIHAETKDGKAEPEKTLWQKYWWYAIPIVIMLLMSGADAPAEGGAAAKK